MATVERGRVRGKLFVIPFVAVIAVTAVVFLKIQWSGRGAPERNRLNLSYTAGLRDLQDGYYLDAVKNLSPVVEANSQPAAAGFRGEAYLQMKKYAEAEADFRRAVKVEPGLPANHAGLGAALQGLGRHREATAAFDAALARFGAKSAAGLVRRTGDTEAEVRRLREASAGRG